MKHILVYLATLPVFIVLDFTWLGFIGKPLYQRFLGNFMRENIVWPSAIIFYLLFVVGLLIFAVYPAVGRGSVGYAAGYGALFGFFTYMTYELTNHAVIKDWPLGIVPIDIIWGTILGAGVSVASYYIASAIL